MVSRLTLTKELNDLRIKASELYNESQRNGTSDKDFQECLVKINSLKVVIDNLKDQS